MQISKPSKMHQRKRRTRRSRKRMSEGFEKGAREGERKDAAN